jgi:signal transduction histidine kinase
MLLKRIFKPKVKTALAIIWFAFTFSLVAWWWVFFLMRLDPDVATLEQIHKSHRMFAWEGSILLAAILIGGVALVVFTYRDQKRHQRLSFFFSTFSHDIKTSIARLRLQAEVLEEDQAGKHPVMKRLIQDIQRLDLQLENSLLLSNSEAGTLLSEDVSLRDIFSSLRIEFPELGVELEKEAFVRGDRRALLSVFKNLLQNSVLHGQASSVKIKVREASTGTLQLDIEDDGLGFKGEHKKLGSELLISQDARSNGIGLLITKRLIEKMNGKVTFKSQENAGFQTHITIGGRLK